jgi:protein SCO1/2
VVLTMFYGGCASVCPLLFERLKRVEQRLSPTARERLRLALVTFDPAHDTRDRLDELATAHGLDRRRWHLLNTSTSAVREVAAVLGVRYRFVADGGVSHSSQIALLDGKGEVALRIDGVEGSEDELVAAIEAMAR